MKEDEIIARHGKVQERIVKSEPSKEKVGMYLKSQRYDIWWEPAQIAPAYNDRRKFSDKGDLHIRLNNRVEHIEVKERDVEFTRQEDFPHEWVFICSVDPFMAAAREGRTPLAVVFLNSANSHVAVTHIFTRNEWKVRPRVYDKLLGTYADTFVIRPDQVMFGPFHEVDTLLLLESVRS
jgi:hypothetical protein